MSKRIIFTQYCIIAISLFIIHSANSADLGTHPVFSVVEITFEGPEFGPEDSPAKDIEFWARFQHKDGKTEYKVYGFWDGDGKGGAKGNVFAIRFCPTKPGQWKITDVHSNNKMLSGQKEGDTLRAKASDHPGFWIPDDKSNGRRWYRRSDGSHQYIYGNTHYSFLSGYEKGGKPSGNDIAGDIKGNAEYFKKLRFGLSGDYYPNPKVKQFLDDQGKQTDLGDYSHRPNPTWFHNRVDLAVETAYDEDLIADLILAGPDTEESRSTLRAKFNDGDPEPFLRYIAARYGSYPNVWICLCNEYEIRTPKYDEKEIIEFGQIIQKYLPYQTPVSVHATPRTLWDEAYDKGPDWYDHQIIQKKIRHLAPAADVMHQIHRNPDGESPRLRPTINDELSYEGKGDRHSEGDTIESHLGAFLGGGYGTTGEKPGSKEGQYFRGKFDASEHTAADNLKWLRELIDENITFWKMAPDISIFDNLDEDFRGMAWARNEYVLGTNKSHEGIKAKLPAGKWNITCYDVMNKKAKEFKTYESKRGSSFEFDSPDSRAVLFHFKKVK